MPDPVKMAFERQVVSLPLSDILPMRRVLDGIKQTARYKRIVSSISEVGIVEPLVVARRAKDGDLSCWLTAICDMPRCSTSAAARRRA
jgi:hypothetical protein